MKKLIVKTNEWYDKLLEPKRMMFFLIFIIGSLLVSQYFTYAKDYKWTFPLCAFTLCFWRLAYIFIKSYELYKKNNIQ